MKTTLLFNVAIVGCGDIAARYVARMQTLPDIIKLVEAYDILKFCSIRP